MQGSHAGHVDPVDVDVDAGPPKHGDDGFSVGLLDALLKDDLIRKPDPSCARMGPGKETRPPGHGSLDCPLSYPASEI